jgi:hypothetical protein
MARNQKKKPRRKPTPSRARLAQRAQKCPLPKPDLPCCPIERFRSKHEKLLSFAHDALTTCLRTHRWKCAPHPFDSAHFLPARLIDIGILKSPKLVSTADSHMRDRRYACLSHQWGKPDDATKATMTTTLSTVDDRTKGLDFSKLPKRYQEAMMICNFLGI